MIGPRLSILGTSLSVTGDDAQLVGTIGRLWSPFVQPSRDGAPPAPDVTLRIGADEPAVWLDGVAEEPRPADRSELAAHATAAINRLALDRYAGFAAHCGVVSRGQTLLAFPGVSGAGKTTLVAACVRGGWTYVSDEALCVNRETGRVTPYPKPLALSAWSSTAVGAPAGVLSAGENLLTSGELGGDGLHEPMELTDVVQLNRSAGGQLDLARLHPAETVAALLEMSFNHYRDAERSFALVNGLARSCRSWQLTYSDPQAAADLLTGTFG